MNRTLVAVALTASVAFAPLPALAQGPDFVGISVRQAIDREYLDASHKGAVGGAMMILSYGAMAGAALALSGPALPIVLAGGAVIAVSGWFMAHDARERLDRVSAAQRSIARGDDPVDVINILYGIDSPGVNVERELQPLVDALAPPAGTGGKNDGFHH